MQTFFWRQDAIGSACSDRLKPEVWHHLFKKQPMGAQRTELPKEWERHGVWCPRSNKTRLGVKNYEVNPWQILLTRLEGQRSNKNIFKILRFGGRTDVQTEILIVLRLWSVWSIIYDYLTKSYVTNSTKCFLVLYNMTLSQHDLSWKDKCKQA